MHPLRIVFTWTDFHLAQSLELFHLCTFHTDHRRACSPLLLIFFFLVKKTYNCMKVLAVWIVMRIWFLIMSELISNLTSNQNQTPQVMQGWLSSKIPSHLIRTDAQIVINLSLIIHFNNLEKKPFGDHTCRSAAAAPVCILCSEEWSDVLQITV